MVWLRESGVPVVMDCTHACQSPPSVSNPHHSGGEREMVSMMGRAAVAVGVDGLFFEFHHDIDNAPVDTNLQLPLEHCHPLLQQLKQIAIALPYYKRRD